LTSHHSIFTIISWIWR